MQRSDFYFELPPALIAQHPSPQRSQSRLLCLDGQSGSMQDRGFTELPALLQAGDLLVFNDTRVIPARLLGHKHSGGKVEVLVERLLDDRRALGYVRASKPPKIGSRFTLTSQTAAPAASAMVLGRKDDLFELRFEDSRSVLEIVETLGHTPLPPYISRPADQADDERYQTVYARHKGAVAAPTAGLHFDRPLLDLLAQRGIESAYITLHVGAGTFHPVRVDTVEEHKMHSEWVVVPEQVCAQVRATRARGGRVIAVGTTSARALESAAQGGELQPFQGETNIFIYPGYRFRTIDALLTNFHLPESTLLMLVCAFAGTERVLAAYRHAVEKGYRFFSYGDAMFVLPQIQDTREKGKG